MYIYMCRQKQNIVWWHYISYKSIFIEQRRKVRKYIGNKNMGYLYMWPTSDGSHSVLLQATFLPDAFTHEQLCLIATDHTYNYSISVHFSRLHNKNFNTYDGKYCTNDPRSATFCGCCLCWLLYFWVLYFKMKFFIVFGY